MKKQVLRNLELLKKEVQNKREPANMGPPELIRIEPDDYHAKYIGRSQDGLQFFLTSLFIPPSLFVPFGISSLLYPLGCEFLALFLFNNEGVLVESIVDKLGPRLSLDVEHARELRKQRLAKLGSVTHRDIQVKPFAVEHYGVMMGLIPSKFEDRWTVELLPGNFMAFWEPWDDGGYDT